MPQNNYIYQSVKLFVPTANSQSMHIVHISAECYPIAKAGGLGDVVGSLPRFQNEMGNRSVVIMPMYRTPYLYTHEWDVVHKSSANLGHWFFEYTIIKECTSAQGFELYLIDINGLLDRERVYGYEDDTERFCAFQISAVHWMNSWEHLPGVVHVHDHHAGLVPFMMQHCYAFKRLASVPSVLTIHNAQYQGQFSWDKSIYVPQWDSWKRGMLEWEGSINPLASAVKCAWKVTTVSTTYLHELRSMSNGLEPLFEYEKGKCIGILNGIDYSVWDPAHDRYLDHRYAPSSLEKGKEENKALLCSQFGLDPSKPLMVFIGRLVGEKGADLLPQVIRDSFEFVGRRMSFLVLGSGESSIEHELRSLNEISMGDYASYIGYNERLSHLMYAGADYLLMPSRVEPCGLNQLYAMRYGTIPIVRKTGGLYDTVIDLGECHGYGFSFLHAAVGDVTQAIYRAVEFYHEKAFFNAIRQKITGLDYSWDRSAAEYIHLYKSF